MWKKAKMFLQQKLSLISRSILRKKRNIRKLSKIDFDEYSRCFFLWPNARLLAYLLLALVRNIKKQHNVK